jgi:hypothetical protein
MASGALAPCRKEKYERAQSSEKAVSLTVQSYELMFVLVNEFRAG